VSRALRTVSDRYRTPAIAIWAVAMAAALATVYTPVYEILAAVTAIFLYISCVVPIALGLVAYGRSWTAMGPWHLGRWYRPLAVVSVLGCVALLVIDMKPPNEKAAWIVGGALLLLALVWFGGAKDRFGGPPEALLLSSSSSRRLAEPSRTRQ
jgi:amino acid transporter